MAKTDVPDVEATTRSTGRIDFNAHKHGYETLVDRGDLPAPDFVLGDFITDGAFHMLPLSPYTGARRTYVLMLVVISLGASPGGIVFRTKGNVHMVNVSVVGGGPGTTDSFLDVEVLTNADGEVEYMAMNIDWIKLDVVIRGVQA